MSLDVLRGVAILLVFGNHAPYVPKGDGVISTIAACWVRVGWTGVDLFFVLSGFLVGGLLFVEIRNRSQLHVGRFFVRRAFKIWPAYIVFLLYITIGHVVKYRHEGLMYSVDALWPNYLHLQNYFGSIRIHTWSLSVEEHFYLLLPLVLLLYVRFCKVHRFEQALFPGIALLLAFLCGWLRWRASSIEQFSYLSIQYPTHLRIDGLFFGVFLSYIYHFRQDVMMWITRWRYLILFVGIALVSPFLVWEMEKSRFLQSAGFTCLYIGYGGILMWAVTGRSEKPVMSKGRTMFRWTGCLLAFIGYYSYSIYLWHVDVGGKPLHILLGNERVMNLHPSLLWSASIMLFIMLGCLGGILLSRIIEMPAIIMRDRLFPAEGPKPLAR